DQSKGNEKRIHFRIISGSSTNCETKAALEQEIDYQPLTEFHATVAPDDFLLSRFRAYLGQLDPHPKVALLAETNSGYSNAFQRKLRPKKQNAADGTPDSCTAQEAIADNWLVLPFPMYISQLRSAYEKTQGPVQPTESPNPVTNPARPTLSVPLSESQDAIDVPSAFTPGMTTGIVDLDLQNLLSTISREGRNYVGLLATDTRDKLFLAKQINKYCPDVRLFTFDSDLLYTHPDFNSYLNGMIVVSSYPLFSRNQIWTSASESSRNRRLQFPMQQTEGIYNAALALLDYTAEGALMPGGRTLIEYSQPFGDSAAATATTPAVWITVVGHGASWPLKIYDDTPAKGADRKQS
ncbi:MAG: hypothetical protein ACREAC_22080, partial [Blastocatellia bacterium]